MPNPDQIINYHKIKKIPFNHCPICTEKIKTGTGTDCFGKIIFDKQMSTTIYDSFKIEVCNDCIQKEIRKILKRKMKNMPDEHISLEVPKND